MYCTPSWVQTLTWPWTNDCPGIYGEGLRGHAHTIMWYLHGVHKHAREAEGHFFGVLAALHGHFEAVAKVNVHHLGQDRSKNG
jgi:hypothetical protein